MKSHLLPIQWQGISKAPKLTEGEVHIWCVDLNLDETQVMKLKKLLNKDEQHRAERFKFPIHRKRFIVAKSFLRKILASYLQVSAEEISFSYGKHGKPFLSPQFNCQLTFNNTASNDLALYAVTLNRAVGIDVEFENKTVDYGGVVERFFSQEETKKFHQLTKEQQKAAFFYGWVQKEAFVKALGTGLAFHLNNFEVNLNPEEPARLIAIENNKQKAKNWRLEAFIPMQNFVACVAVEGQVTQLKYFKLENVLAPDRF